jgi:integrase
MARKRRGRNEGSIFKRADGQWAGSISLGYSESGKRKRRTVYGESEAEVQDKIRKLQNDAATGQLADAGNLTVAEYLDRWLENTARPRVQPKTHLRYTQLARLRIKPTLGGVRLAKLTPLHVDQLFATLERAGVSARGRQMAGTMLHTALRDAVKLHLIPHNPARDVAKPIPAKQEMQVYDREQVHRFLDAARQVRLYAMYVLALDAGLRQGELFALQWPDVDFTQGCLFVRRSLEEINGRLRVKEPKSARSQRRIDLSRFALDALNEHRQRMLAEGRDVKGAAIFCDQQGGWLRKGNVLRRSVWPIIANANARATKEAEEKGVAPALVPSIRFHDFRHTCATLLLADENVKVVSERLGHASVQLTLDTYSHVLPTMQKRAAEQWTGFFYGRRPVRLPRLRLATQWLQFEFDLVLTAKQKSLANDLLARFCAQ